MATLQTPSASKRIRLDEVNKNHIDMDDVHKDIKDDNKEKPFELIDLPTDMIDVITSLLLLTEIIQIQKSCKIFHQICKLNTNEIIIYKRNNKCTKYLQHYNKNKRENETFRFKHIKRLKIVIGRINSNSFIKHFQSINPIMKYHSNLSYCEIDEISSSTATTDCLIPYTNFCDNLITNNIPIHYLEFAYCTAVAASTKLLSQAVDRVTFHYVSMNYKLIEALNHSTIKHINVNDIIITNTPTKYEISFGGWRTLQSFSVTLHNSSPWEDSKKFLQSLISQPPNLKFISIEPPDFSFKWINKISKSVKILTLKEFFLKRNVCQEFVRIHKDHKFDQIILKCNINYNINCDEILSFIGEMITNRNFIIKMAFDFDLSNVLPKLMEAIEKRKEFVVVGGVNNLKEMSNKYDDIYYIVEFKGCKKDGKVHVKGTYPDIRHLYYV